MDTLLLTQSDARSLVVMRDAVDAVEAAFASHGRAEAEMPSKIYLDLEQHHGDFRAMPAYLDGWAGLKWVNAHPQNPKRHGLPAVRALFILSDPATAEPLAVMDATWLTAVRTGAAAAVATRYLARSDAASIGLIGTGAQAHTLLEALRIVVSNADVVAADRDAETASAFAGQHGGRTGSVAEAAGCDIVCTATPSRQPIIERRWIRPGVHINAMGADGHGKQELDPQILRSARVVVDDLEQASTSGEINVPLARGELELRDLHASLGQVVAGDLPGRVDESEITVFDSTGLALQDVALARLVYQRAIERGVGRRIDFIA